MDSEERPRKIRRLDAQDEQPLADAAQSHEEVTAAIEHTPQNGEDHETVNGVSHVDKGIQSPSKASHSFLQSSDSARSGHASIVPADESKDSACQDDEASVTADKDDQTSMSKNQLKKLRKKEEWEAKREDRKVKRKQKIVARRERKREATKEAEATGQPLIEKQPQPQGRPVQLPVSIIIDCDFDDLMRDGERISLGQQLTRCYSDNKRAKYRAFLTIASFRGKLKERFDGLLAKHYESWKGVTFSETDFVATANAASAWMHDPQYYNKLAGPVFSATRRKVRPPWQHIRRARSSICLAKATRRSQS